MKMNEFKPYEEEAKAELDTLLETRYEASEIIRKRAGKRQWQKYTEKVIHLIFLLLGLITVGCVLLITVYLIISGLPAIKEIGLFDFLFGKEWASTAEEPKYGILPFILTSVYGTAGAILIGVPIGFFTAVFLAFDASRRLGRIFIFMIRLLAAIPSVVYGFFGISFLLPF